MNTYQHILLLQKLFKHLGISEDRIQQYFCSAADVEKFVSSVEDITKKFANYFMHNGFVNVDNDITKKIALLPPLPKKIKSELV